MAHRHDTRAAGSTHAANAVGFEIGAAVVGGALIPIGIGVLAARAGLEVLGPSLLATTGLMLGLHLAWTRPGVHPLATMLR